MTKLELLKIVNNLKGNKLKEVIYNLEFNGYYRDDKRKKKEFIKEVVKTGYNDNIPDIYKINNDFKLFNEYYDKYKENELILKCIIID